MDNGVAHPEAAFAREAGKHADIATASADQTRICVSQVG